MNRRNSRALAHPSPLPLTRVSRELRALALSHTRFEPGTHKLRVRYTIFCGHLPHVHLYYSEPLLTRYTDGLPRLLVGHVHERALLDALRVQAPI